MGVYGLWRLLDATGRQVPLETLEGKVLAVDISIWIYQVIQGYQDRFGNPKPNAHLLGLYSRICKLLYYKIKPVFVFDGGVPLLKKDTVASRRKQKSMAKNKAEQMRAELINNLMKHSAVMTVLNSDEKTVTGKVLKLQNKQTVDTMFHLPDMPSTSQTESNVSDDYDSDSSTELNSRKQTKWIGNIHNVNVSSTEFKALPADVRYDILTDLKDTRKQNSWGRLHEMPEESNEFSGYQMKRLLKRRLVQESLESAEKEMGGKTLTLDELDKLLTEQGVTNNDNDSKYRIAGDSTTRLIYIDKNALIKSSSSDVNSKDENNTDITDETNESAATSNDVVPICEDINEYAFDDEWDSDIETKSTSSKLRMDVSSDSECETGLNETQPLRKKYFEKDVTNPALSYMFEHSGLTDKQIRMILEQKKKEDHKINTEESEEIDLTNAELCENKNTAANIQPCTSMSNDSKETAKLDSIETKSIHISDTDLPITATSASNNKQNEEADVCVISSTDSDTDSDFIEVENSLTSNVNTDNNAKTSQQSIEITFKAHEKVEDDIFADVFETSGNDLSVETVSQNTQLSKETPEEWINFPQREETKNEIVSKQSDVESEKAKERNEKLYDVTKPDKINIKMTEGARNVEDKKSEKAKERNEKLSDITKTDNINVKMTARARNVEDRKSEKAKERNEESFDVTKPDKINVKMTEGARNVEDKKSEKAKERNEESFDVTKPNKINVKMTEGARNVEDRKSEKAKKRNEKLYDVTKPDKINIKMTEGARNVEDKKSEKSKKRNEKLYDVTKPDKINIKMTEGARNVEDRKSEKAKERNEKLSDTTKTDNINVKMTEGAKNVEDKKSEKAKERNEKLSVITKTDNINVKMTAGARNLEDRKSEKAKERNEESFDVTKPDKINVKMTEGARNVEDKKSEKAKERNEKLSDTTKTDNINVKMTEGSRNVKDKKSEKAKERNEKLSDTTKTDNINVKMTEGSRNVKDKKSEKAKERNEKLSDTTKTDNINVKMTEGARNFEDKKLEKAKERNEESFDVTKPDNINVKMTEGATNVEQAEKNETEETYDMTIATDYGIDSPEIVHEEDNADVNAPIIVDSDNISPLPVNEAELLSLKDQLEDVQAEILTNIGKFERQGMNISQRIKLEAQELLRLFGVPYVDAPMEAEAQCAYLEQIHLTDGTITDDSDIWLFGGQCVYKNFFDNNKSILQYRSSDIEHHFKLTRNEMIRLALLVGSDYTIGVTGIGPVTALEILAAFPSEGTDLLRGLMNFYSWIENGKVVGPGKTALRNKLQNVQIHKGFPSQAVVQAYLFPEVDESKESFTWGKPNVTLLSNYTKQKFGWTKAKFDEIMTPVMKKLEAKQSQRSMKEYIKVQTVPKSIEPQLSKRVQKAVQRLNNPEAEDFESAQQSEQQQKKRKKSKSGNVKRRKNESKSEKNDVVDSVKPKIINVSVGDQNLEEQIPQREKDKADALKKRLHAIEVVRKSKQGLYKTKKVKRCVRKVKNQAELSESDSS